MSVASACPLAPTALATLGIPLLVCQLLGGPALEAMSVAAPRPRGKARTAPRARASGPRAPRPAPSPPKVSLRQILGDLDHTDPGRRADAAWEAGRQRLQGASQALGKRLRDRNATVRRNAAWALGELGRPESAFPLHDRVLRETAPTVQAELVVALGKVHYRTTRPLLLGYTWKADPVLQAAGISALGYLGDPSVVPYLRRFQSHPDPVLRRALAQTLGRLGGQAARKALLHLLADSASAVQSAALEAASRQGILEAAPVAERLLGKGPSELRRSAAAALRALGSRRHLASLAPLLDDELPEVAAEAALTTAHLGGTIPADRLLELLASRHNAATRATARAAGLSGCRECIPALEALLDRASPSLREAAAEALGRLAASQSLAKLLRRLSEAHPDELPALLGAIGALRDASALWIVAPLLSHPDSEVRAASVDALAEMAILDPRPFAFLPRLLVPLLASHQPPVLLRAAADALAWLPSPRPREGFIALMRLTWHPRAEVRGAAARGLGRHGDRLARPVVERLRRDPDPAVRLDASLALLRLGPTRGQGPWPEAALPDCDLQPRTLLARCLLLRASWRPRERVAAAAAFRQTLSEGPNLPETSTLVDSLAELDASFALPLLHEARLSTLYLVRAAAERALSIWPPPVHRSNRETSKRLQGSAAQAKPALPSPASPQTRMFDSDAARGGCDCRTHGQVTRGWLWGLLMVVFFLGGRRGIAPSYRTHPCPPGGSPRPCIRSVRSEPNGHR